MNPQDLHRVNMLLSRSFTQGRFDDGYQMTHVPMCRPDFLEMYYWGCPEGCFVIEENSKLVAAAFCHVWGKTGWIGPLAVTPENHLLGLGKEIAEQSIEFLKEQGCKTIGLEANPRSNRNMGFYAKLGFLPKSLSLDMMRKVAKKIPKESPHELLKYNECNDDEKIDFLAGVRLLSNMTLPDVDYRPLIAQLYKFKYGESLLFVRNDTPIAFAIMQTISTSSEEDPNILRVIALLTHPKTPDFYFKLILADLENYAREHALQQVLVRVPTNTPKTYRYLIANRFRIIFSDVRLTLEGFPEKVNPTAFHLSRWA